MNANFQYAVLPSASQIGELPAYLAFKGVKSDNVGIAIAGYVSGFVAIPISIVFTPIGIIADIVVGIAEASFIAYKGATGKDIQELLFKKVIVCAIQQALSVTTKTVIFVICPIFWPLSYSASQGIVKTLPNCLNHKRMNIFINGGITDKQSNKTWFDEETELKPYQFKNDGTRNQSSSSARAKGAFKNRQSNSQTPLMARIADVRASVSRINNAHTPKEYLQFKQKILNQASAQDIFEFGNSPFTRASLLKKYKQLLLVVHPDKNPDLQNEAHLMFHCLQEAFLELERLVI